MTKYTIFYSSLFQHYFIFNSDNVFIIFKALNLHIIKRQKKKYTKQKYSLFDGQYAIIYELFN
ncbi:hypothetical protein PROSTU_01272 [Providencia stuartii ATCC 25827]|uniref:Uncharacterized protein n=1 Tax=Providencia stuartii ATCC 25827 TaxID=471874 RepID=A0AA87CSD4_PROST|nr:hypothetical protein PROSTU_01272 [Providencia stuartii ATCC 25827]